MTSNFLPTENNKFSVQAKNSQNEGNDIKPNNSLNSIHLRSKFNLTPHFSKFEENYLISGQKRRERKTSLTAFTASNVGA